MYYFASGTPMVLFVLPTLWHNAHVSYLHTFQAQWRRPGKKVCLESPKAKMLKTEGLLWCHTLGRLPAPGTFFSLGSWGVQYADRGKVVCSLRAASHPWSPMSRKCQGNGCLTGPVGHPLTQKQVMASWLTTFLAILLMPIQRTPYKGQQNTSGKKFIKFSDSEWVHRK